MTSQNVNAKQYRKVASSVLLDIFFTFLGKNEKNNHHIEGGTRESHPCVLDAQMGFPLPSLNVVLDSIIL